MANATRTETDSIGPIEVPADRLWGAQTQRSRQNFAIGEDRFAPPLIRAFLQLKKAAARTNRELDQVPAKIAAAIESAATKLLDARDFQTEFPLSVWQTGSGTQTNMNVNEVLANLASEALGGTRGEKKPVHPNDHVNRGQSSNDTFPTAMHLATGEQVRTRLLPALDALHGTLHQKATAFANIVKVGRTHLQDATPVTLGQEISGWAAQLLTARRAIEHALEAVDELALGGTAVGTGLGAHPQFAEQTIRKLAIIYNAPLRPAENRFAALAGHEALVAAHGTLKTLACALMKIANDVRWLASGPRSGLGELTIPANEPGSSIMPGKVNPTQSEALTMVCAQVLGNDVAVNVGGMSGNFELNVFKPLIIRNVLHSLEILSDAMVSFEEHCARGIEPNRERMKELVDRSLMLVTALAPSIGYDAAAKIAKKAHGDGTTLREAALELRAISPEEFDRLMDPKAMT